MTEYHIGLDFSLLLKLRSVVVRFGEMDGARWWNTKGVLGSDGAFVLGRGFPATHFIAQARIGAAVAQARSREVFMPPKCHTLWDLPAEVEDRYDVFLQDLGRHASEWEPFFTKLQPPPGSDLLQILKACEIPITNQREDIQKLRRSAENRAVLLPASFSTNDRTITLLAAAFCKGEPGQPAIPYIRAEEDQ
jgi:hypothetical protein